MGPDILRPDDKVLSRMMGNDPGDTGRVVRGRDPGRVGQLVTEWTVMLSSVIGQTAKRIERLTHRQEGGLAFHRFAVRCHLMRGHGTQHREETRGEKGCERAGATAKHGVSNIPNVF